MSSSSERSPILNVFAAPANLPGGEAPPSGMPAFLRFPMAYAQFGSLLHQKLPTSQWDWSRPIPSNKLVALDPPLRKKLNVIEQKVIINKEGHEDSAWKDSIKAHLRLMSHSFYRNALELVHCGEHGDGEFANRTFRCRDRFCPLCCGYKGQLLANEFCAPVPNGVVPYHIVLGVSPVQDEKRRLTIEAGAHQTMPADLSEGPPQWLDYYLPFKREGVFAIRKLLEIFRKAIYEFSKPSKKRFIDGALGGGELAIKFLPLLVMPHSHFLAFLPTTFDEQHGRSLRTYIRNAMRNSREIGRWRKLVGPIHPTVFAERLETDEQSQKVARYTHKTVELAKAYESARIHALHDPAAMVTLNDEVKVAVRLIMMVQHSVRRITRFRACDSRCKAEYFGTPRQRKPKARKSENRIRKKKVSPQELTTEQLEDAEFDKLAAAYMDMEAAEWRPRYSPYENWASLHKSKV